MSAKHEGPQVHNSAPERKVALRKRLIELLDGPLHVLETHSGPAIMRTGCYKHAASWVGIDKDPESPGAIHAPSEKVLRAIDLDGFNFFDVDPFGNPWEHIWLIAQRRKVEGRIALVITSGVQGNLNALRSSFRSAGWSQQMADAIKCSDDKLPRHFVGNKGASRCARTYVKRWFDPQGWSMVKWVETKSPANSVWYFGVLLDAAHSDARR